MDIDISQNNKRYFYQLDGEGIRYEIVAFARAVESKMKNLYVEDEISEKTIGVIEEFNNRRYIEI